MSVTIDGFSTDRIYWTLWYSAWLHVTVHQTTHTGVHSHVFTSRCLVAAYPFLWIPELSPATATSFSQQQLTMTVPQRFSNSLTNQLHWISPESESESESFITTDGQSASLSWNKAPDFYYCQTVAGLLMWGALSDERTGLSFTISSGPRPPSHFRVRVPWDSWPYFTASDSRLSFRRLLRLAGLRWRYSTPPPHGSLFNWPTTTLSLSCL
jgi:hypothetical protein